MKFIVDLVLINILTFNGYFKHALYFKSTSLQWAAWCMYLCWRTVDSLRKGFSITVWSKATCWYFILSMTGCAQQEMIHNLLFPLSAESCQTELRVYNIVHQFQTTDVDVLLGRAGHIALIDNELCLERLVQTCLYRFFQTWNNPLPYLSPIIPVIFSTLHFVSLWKDITISPFYISSLNVVYWYLSSVRTATFKNRDSWVCLVQSHHLLFIFPLYHLLVHCHQSMLSVASVKSQLIRIACPEASRKTSASSLPACNKYPLNKLFFTLEVENI